MPFSGSGDAKLPARIKKLSAKKRRQFVAAFNSIFAATGDEGRAFAGANAAIKEFIIMDQTVAQMREAAKELPENDPHRALLEQTATTLEERTEKEEDEKCGEAIDITIQHQPMGGSLTFAEADDFQDGEEIDRSIWEEKNTFDRLHRNIWNSDRLITEKARLTEQAANDLARRIGAVEAGERSTIMDKVKKFVFGEQQEESPAAEPIGEIAVFKDVDGNWRWVAAHSNNRFDREDEVFPAAVHKEFEGWIAETGKYPELRLWHVPGSRIGRADFIGFDESSGFLLSSGTFDKGMEDVAEKLAKDNDLACSHGYEYRPEDLDKEGVYARYRSFEVTVLPAAHAANPWTAITMSQIAEEVKGMDEQRRAFLVEKMGEERTKRIEDQLAAFGKELNDAGIDFKDVIEAPVTEASVATEEKPTAATEKKPVETAAEVKPTETATAPTGEEQKATVDPTSELMSVLSTAIREQMAPLSAAVAELQGSVKELRATKDSEVAATMQPRTRVAEVASQRPTEQASNMKEKEGDEATAGGVEAAGGEAINPYLQMALNGARVIEQG